MVEANQQSEWITKTFIKYFVGRSVMGIIIISLMSLFISFIVHGNIEVEHLFIPAHLA